MSIISKLFRKNLILKAPVAIRGGGGIPRPDVPVVIRYEHKRILSMYDLNVWWYDNTMPEYLVTLQDNHLRDHIGALKEMGNILYAVGIAYLIVGVYMWTITESYLPVTFDFDQTDLVTRYKKTRINRPGSKRHFLGLDVTAGDGIFHGNPDFDTYSLRKIDRMVKEAGVKRQINTEVKNTVTRIENEVRAKHQSHHDKPHHGEHHTEQPAEHHEEHPVEHKEEHPGEHKEDHKDAGHH